MAVSASRLPRESALWQYARDGDFMDCYRATDVPAYPDMETAMRASVAHMPAWIGHLMDLRNRIVGPLGLKAGRHSRQNGDTEEGQFALESDGKRILFTVRERREDEIIIGEDDRHLDFRITIFRDDSGWYVATWVHPHAWYGWVYLYTVMPFHKLIMRLSAKRLEQGGTVTA